MFRLHGFSHSSSTWRVRIALALKGLAVEAVPVNVRPGVDEQYAAGFEALNPARQIPVLEWQHGGEGGPRRLLGQSMAILRYLDVEHPEPPLWPRDAYLGAHAMQLAELVNAGIQPLQNNRVQGRLRSLGVDAEAWARTSIEDGLAALEATARHRAGRYLVADAPSVADLYAVPQLYNARRFGIDVDAYGTLARCEAACLELPAFASTHPDA